MAMAYLSAVSNKSILATASVLSLVIGEFVLVLGEYASVLSRIIMLISYQYMS